MGKNLFFFLVLFTWACAAPQSVPTAAPTRRWPPPPQSARIEWIGAIDDFEALGPKSLWRRLAEAVTGPEPARFTRPYGVLATRDGHLVVADTGGGRVVFIDRQVNRPRLIGDEGESRFISPVAAAEDDRGQIYLTDSAAGLVYRYDPRNETLTKFAPHHLNRPTGIAFNPRNRLLYITETASHQVVAYDLAGIEQVRIGSRGTAPGQLNYPTDLWIDRLGQIYVSDPLNHRIQVFTPEGQVVTLLGKSGDAGGYMPKPKGVAVDSEGHIYVVDALLDAVQIFDDSGRLLLDFGARGEAFGEFWMPSGIFIDREDVIYVTDTYNRRIQIFRYLADMAESE